MRHASDEMRRRASWRAYLGAALIVGLVVLFSYVVFGRHDTTDVAMTFVLGIVLVSLRFGHAPSVFAALLSVVSFDFVFTPPYFSFAVDDLRHALTFAVMFLVAVLISGLTGRVRAQADAASARERRTAALYAMSRDLVVVLSTSRLIEVAVGHIDGLFEARSCVLLPDDAGELPAPGPEGGARTPLDKEAAAWAWKNGAAAGVTASEMGEASSLYVPLVASRGRVGVLGVRPTALSRLADPEQRALLDSFANQLALALERALFAEEKRAMALRVETEALRNSLLSSVSHELRTPLAVITGAASVLVEDDALLRDGARLEISRTVYDESRRLNQLVANLLEMTKIEAGALRVRKEWQSVEEVVGAALDRAAERLRGREVTTRVPRDLPLVRLDAVSVAQVLGNLLENIVRYTPAATPIEIEARLDAGAVRLDVVDHGPGLPAHELGQVFEKFHRVAGPGAKGGTGLGLTITRGVIEAHGGRVWAENEPGGGLRVSLTLPVEPDGPAIHLPESSAPLALS